MKKLETNDWLILNSIIYNIYTMDNFDQMRETLLDELKTVMDFDSADFYLASSEPGHILDNPVTLNCKSDMCQTYEELDYSRGIMLGGKTIIYRETDIISDDVRVETDYYKRVYKPNNWHYSLQMIIAKHKKFLGVITFYRSVGKENFHYDDIFILDILKDHLAYRLEQQQKMRADDDGTEKVTIMEAVEKYELTKREHTILQMLMSGKENTVICEELMISGNTLKKHILNIYRKLDVKNRVQLFKLVKEKE